MPAIDTIIDNKFRIVRLAGNGAIGTVYYAERIDGFDERVAIKLVPFDTLRDGWQREIQKALKLGNGRGEYNISSYRDHGKTTIDGVDYLWIATIWIDGISVKKLIADKKMTLPILLSVIKSTLHVLHGCKALGMQHGDLHAGNIMVEPPGELSINNTYKAYIIDFGYLSASMGKPMMDDYLGLSRIIQDSVAAIPFHSSSGEEKKYLSILKHQFSKYLLETNSTAGEYVRTPLVLLEKLVELKNDFHPSENITYEKHISDCLAAELMGERFSEWQELFVPDFLASSQILAHNPSVITGLRGCGKTTIFRRLSALFNCHLGVIDLPGANKFIGCYQNARNLAEAFPWLPPNKVPEAQNQIIKYFHISWCLDIIAWLSAEKSIKQRDMSFEWLYNFFSTKLSFAIVYDSPDSLFELKSHLISLLNKSRLHDKYLPEENTELTEISFLDELVLTIKKHCPWLGDRPFFFFFDDYSTPLISESFQKILNAIIFRRSPDVIFKVATESVESFFPVGLNDKRLEENDDYVLIDFGSLHLLNKDEDNCKIISAILNKRINRDTRLSGKGFELSKLLGDSPTFVDFAQHLRDAPRKAAHYRGYTFLCAMWSCDIREIIRLFASMVDLADISSLTPENPTIPSEIQDKAMRNAGGKYVALLGAATHPGLNTYEMEIPHEKYKSYGAHLKQIAEAFHQVASDELKRDIKNEETKVPKQARRIEITESCSELPDDAKDFYKGIIRYGLFVRDTRGKSVRGHVVPRLYLRGLLIPYFRLSFSKRDSISMGKDDFIKFLCSPEDFVAERRTSERRTIESTSRAKSDDDNQLTFDFKE